MTDEKKPSISRRAVLASAGAVAAAQFLTLFPHLGLAADDEVVNPGDTLGHTFEVIDLKTGQWYVNYDRSMTRVPFLMRFIVDAKTQNADGSYTLKMRFDKKVSKPWAEDGTWRVWYMVHTHVTVDGREVVSFGPGYAQEVADYSAIRHESAACTFTVAANHTAHVTNTQVRYGEPGIQTVGSSKFDFYLHVLAQHTVTFKSGYGDNNVLKTQTVNHGSGALAPKVPDRTGYTFTGWDKAFTNVTDDMTVTAKWRPNTYTIRFNGNGKGVSGSTPDQAMTYDVAKNLNSNGFERHELRSDGRTLHYAWKGWATSSGGGVVYANGARVNNLTATDGDVVNLYAVWEPINGWFSTDKNAKNSAWL